MKVSIVIPVYNSSRYLEQTLTSAVNQTWADKEIILVDDGSSDNSLEIAQSVAATYPEVYIYAQPKGGACKARNYGYRQSTGDYIQFLDADDLLSPDKIESQMKLISADHTKVMSCSWMRFRKESELEKSTPGVRFLDRDWDDPVDWLLSSWEGKGMGQTAVWLVHRSLIEKAGAWNEALSINQDGEFFSRVLLSASGIKFSSNGVVYYRSGIAESISQGINERKASDLLLSYRCYENTILNRVDTPRVRWALSRNYLSFIYTYYDDYPDLIVQAKEAIHRLGTSLKPIAGSKNFMLVASCIGFENSLRLRSVWRSWHG